jgi:hypothetical protein
VVIEKAASKLIVLSRFKARILLVRLAPRPLVVHALPNFILLDVALEIRREMQQNRVGDDVLALTKAKLAFVNFFGLDRARQGQRSPPKKPWRSWLRTDGASKPRNIKVIAAREQA